MLRWLKYKNTCIVGSVYGLIVYLLQCPDDDVKRTYYCVDTAIQSAINVEGLDVKWFDWFVKEKQNKTNGSTWLWRWRRISTFFKYFFIRFTHIYAQDQLIYAPLIINRHSYVLIEDAPRIFTICEEIPHWQPFELPRTFKGMKKRIRMGAIYGRFLGTNKYCKNRLITSSDDVKSRHLIGRKFTLLNLQELWKEASSYKKTIILRMFNISDDLLLRCSKCQSVLLTQPYFDDGLVTEQELVDVYKPYIEKYSNGGIIIKPHPRDTVNYEKYFPNVIYVKTKAPMELFSILGIHFKNAITICSMAVTSLPKPVNIIWIGAGVHPNISRLYGDLQLKDIR